MELVYFFYEADAVRIPLFDYDKNLFRLLVSAGGGTWNNERQEFMFDRNVSSSHFRQITFYLPCVLVKEDSPWPAYVFRGNFPFCCIVKGMQSPRTATRFAIQKPTTHFPSPPTSAPLTKYPNHSPAMFTMLDPPQPEKFPEHWETKLEAELRSRKYSPQTRRSYLYYNRLLCRTLQKLPEEINPDDITRFLAIVEKDKAYSASSINLAISAIKFFYREVLKSENIDERHRPRHDGRLPQVLSKEEIAKILSMEKNPKHRLLLMLVYSSGLRVSEVVALKKEHIDISRKVIYVRQGKGRKDRCTLLSEKAAQFITEYCKTSNIR